MDTSKPESKQLCLGLTCPSCMYLLATFAIPSDFTENRVHIFEAMRNLFWDNEPVDWVTVVAKLTEKGKIPQAITAEEIVKLVDFIPGREMCQQIEAEHK